MSKITAIDINETRDYICEVDRIGEAQPAIWKLGVLDALTRAKVEKQDVSWNPMNDEAKITTNFSGREVEYVRYGLRGFLNFLDKEGKEIPFKTTTIGTVGRGYQVVADDTLRRIPIAVIKELAREISKDNTLTDSERKN